jgi:lysophospholipase L1-like esterase
MRTTTTLAVRLGLVLLGVALALAIVDFGLRIAMPSTDFRFPTYRLTDGHFTSRAGKSVDGNGVHYVFDAEGFRIDGMPSPTGPSRRILFIGDSFTQGFGVAGQDTFAALTCERLRTSGIDAVCLNAGVTGFGTAHELRLLRRLLDRTDLRFDAVVFQLCPYNDLRDNWEDGGFALRDGRLTERNPPQIPFSVRLRLALLENGFAHRSPLVTTVANAWVDWNGGTDPMADATSVALESALLREAVAIAQHRNIPVVFLVAATGWERDLVSTRPYDEADRITRMAAAVQELGVPWIDSRRAAPRADEYIENDGHFSAAGHAAIADALAPILADRLQR